ncbi:MAG: hypothetical protein BGO43_13985 [Gammaproteobacteria bacterium 39-13]|nr:hypothetical protein [Gammaproteobacteria bacterium]OJV85794.1 MAG: hypothetical protein BGO43_13985 [Gammaproteobacteria bacterium 39-13]
MKELDLNLINQISGAEVIVRPSGVSCECWVATEVIVALTYNGYLDREIGYLITDSYCTTREYQTMYDALA